MIPDNLFPMLWDIYQNKNNTSADEANSGFDHRYGIDGDPVLYWKDLPRTNSGGTIIGPPDNRVSTKEDAVVVFGFRKGARDYYALQLSNTSTSSPIYPDNPVLAWRLNPIAQKYGPPASATSDSSGVLSRLGLSTAVPSFGTVLGTVSGTTKLLPALFLSGGYSNAQIDANYNAPMGRSVFALNPLTGQPVVGVNINQWDFTTTSGSSVTAKADSITGQTFGAIPGGVYPTPVISLASGLTHRLYFGDTNGNVWAINSSSRTSLGYRQDNSDISTWESSPRLLFHKDGERFTNAPSAYRLPGDYPNLTTVSTGSGNVSTRLLTVMVSIGSGDRNNPIDRNESYTTVSGTSGAAYPPILDRLYVLADRQDMTSGNNALAQSNLSEINGNWPQCYSTVSGSTTIVPGQFDATSSSYMWTDSKLGYYFDLGYGTHPSAYWTFNQNGTNVNNTTFDKVLVSPLIKEGSLFYSFSNVSGNSGFDCSAMVTTRTFRQCDILRPLYFDPQLSTATTITNTNSLSKNFDACNASTTNPACSGLAFFFNSLASQLVDTGDYVMQGGAKSDSSVTATTTTGVNTPSIQNVKDTGAPPGFRIRNWRIIR
jgi:hypothetical protein